MHAVELMRVFAGLQRAYGIYKIQQTDSPGKKKGDARTLQQQVTEAIWQQHVAGEIQLGIVPIRDDATAMFGAIDIDDYRLNHGELEQKIARANLPLVMVRSKSGGAHLYVFMKEPTAAEAVRELLAGWAATLGYSNVEIFPKQDRLISGNDTGNWINMPYCGGDASDRHAIKDGRKLTIDEFLALVEVKRVSADIFSGAEEFPELLEAAPPCLVTLANNHFPEGARNNGLFNLAVYCRKRWDDGWEDRVVEMNEKFLSPPLESGEVQQIIKNVSKKYYSYRCKEPPINSVCQRRSCVKRKYGINSVQSQTLFGPQLENVIRLETDPPMYFADFANKRICFQALHLVTQSKFREMLITQANVSWQQMPPIRWHSFTAEICQQAVLVEAPPQTNREHDIIDHLEEYCLDRWPGKKWRDVIDGAAFESQGRVYFRPNKLIHAINKEHRLRLTATEVYQALLRIEVQNATRKIGKKEYNLWSVPAFKRPEEESDDEV